MSAFMIALFFGLVGSADKAQVVVADYRPNATGNKFFVSFELPESRDPAKPVAPLGVLGANAVKQAVRDLMTTGTLSDKLDTTMVVKSVSQGFSFDNIKTEKIRSRVSACSQGEVEPLETSNVTRLEYYMIRFTCAAGKRGPQIVYLVVGADGAKVHTMVMNDGFQTMSRGPNNG